MYHCLNYDHIAQREQFESGSRLAVLSFCIFFVIQWFVEGALGGVVRIKGMLCLLFLLGRISSRVGAEVPVGA